ncbi:MAG: lysyl-tRNA synthetase class 2 [Gammaproteobacteria bacterium]|jgi:lysyl-tRNA synthetase class 2
MLRRRASAMRQIRDYFAAQDVLEVETPLLMPWGSQDPALTSFTVSAPAEADNRLRGYLQTSPEFAMKRLLACGSGDIFQLCHAFRVEEPGRHHLAEFVLLEWYRLGFDHHQLMDEVEAVVSELLPSLFFERKTYAELFESEYGFDPHTASTPRLSETATATGVELGIASDDRAILFDVLFAQLFLRTRSASHALFVYDFPIEQCAYARIAPGPPAVAQRFELIIGGVEIANGYFELTDYEEQLDRHRHEGIRRQELKLPIMKPDPLFLAALDAGMPSCAGVALGVDRLLMLSAGEQSLNKCTSFDPYGTLPECS